MKFMKKIGGLLGVLLFVASAVAQHYPGPPSGQALGSVFAIAGSSTSNLTAISTVYPIPVGANGVGLSFTVYGTNAATTTNAIVRLQGATESPSGGINWISTPTTASEITIAVPQNGTAVYTVYTNLLATNPNLGNLAKLRISSIQNTNLATLWVSNITWSIR